MKQIAFLIPLLTVLAAPISIQAQTNPEPHAKTADASPDKRFYRLEFTVKQLEGGHVINSREYSVVLGGKGRTSMRSGTRIPYKHEGIPDFLNIGLSIDCANTEEVNGQLSLHLKADLSSLIGPPASAAELPVQRTNLWESDVILPLRKSTVLFSSDDLSSKQNIQLELLATPIK